MEAEEREREIVRKENEYMLNEVKNVKVNMEEKLDLITNLETNITNKTSKCLLEVLRLASYFYQKYEEIDRQREVMQRKTSQETLGLRENIETLRRIEESIENGTSLTRQALEANKGTCMCMLHTGN